MARRNKDINTNIFSYTVQSQSCVIKMIPPTYANVQGSLGPTKLVTEPIHVKSITGTSVSRIYRDELMIEARLTFLFFWKFWHLKIVNRTDILHHLR